jgi:hypothetical protein
LNKNFSAGETVMPYHEAQDLTLLLFRPLWQTPFTPENRHIPEIISELLLRALVMFHI